jgi:hypothetical protein
MCPLVIDLLFLLPATAQANGLACPACQGVGNKDAAWGTLKTHYR